jgi:hypothetical protein
MENLSKFVNAKMFNNNRHDNQEESYLLGPTTKQSSNSINNRRNTPNPDDFDENYVNNPLNNVSQIDAIQGDAEFILKSDLSDNDLHSYNSKTRFNRINEWQAAWNVTNAIQVRFDCEIFFIKFVQKVSHIGKKKSRKVLYKSNLTLKILSLIIVFLQFYLHVIVDEKTCLTWFLIH